MCSRPTLVDRNAFPMCSDALPLDARQTKCIFYMLKCALARRPSIQMRFLCAQMYSRSTLANLNVFSVCLDVLHFDTFSVSIFKAMADLYHIALFGHLFCSDLDQAMFTPGCTSQSYCRLVPFCFIWIFVLSRSGSGNFQGRCTIPKL